MRRKGFIKDLEKNGEGVDKYLSRILKTVTSHGFMKDLEEDGQ